MQVKALKNIIANREIYDAGEVFEIDDVTGYKLAEKGLAEIIGKSTEPAEFEPGKQLPDPDMTFTDGLPSLDEEVAAKRKRK